MLRSSKSLFSDVVELLAMFHRLYTRLIFTTLLIILQNVVGIAEEGRGLQYAVNELVNDEVVVGRTWAVFIAIDRYENWLPLRNPVQDARDIRSILMNRYYIDEVVELYDEKATKGGIARLFDELFQNVGRQDSVFIYYAGHGYLDSLSNTGFWIPVDGGTDRFDQDKWLSNSVIRGYVSNIRAKDVALFVDSCFSGDILNPTRGAPPEINNEYFRLAYQRRSRQVVTSGASETVPDTSEFAQQLKASLERNTRPYIDPLLLFNEIRLGITKTTPLFGSIQGSIHQDGGSFVFFLKDFNGIEAKPAFRVERDIASIRVSTYDAGKLYVDGAFATDVEANRSVYLRDIDSGDHKIEMRYPSYTESHDIDLAKNVIQELAFVYEAEPKFDISVDPGIEGLSVYIDDTFVGWTPFAGAVSVGNHQVRIEGEWIETAEQTVHGETRSEASFDADINELGALRFLNDLPANSIVVVNDERISVSDSRAALGLKMPVGTYTVSISAPTIQPLDIETDVRAGRITQLDPTPVFRTGVLRLVDLPHRVNDISVDGTIYGRDLIASEIQLVIGEHQVYFTNPFGENYVDTVRILEGDLLSYEAPTGILVLENLPDKMNVSVGGVTALAVDEVGESKNSFSLLPGSYDVHISGKSALSESFSIEIARNSTVHKNLDITLLGEIFIKPPDSGSMVDLTLSNSSDVFPDVEVNGIVELPVGTYTVNAKHVDDVEFSFNEMVDVERGSTSIVDLSSLSYSPRHDLNLLQVDLRRAQSRTIGGWISFAVGVLSSGGGVLSYIEGQRIADEYRNAESTAAAISAREQLDTLSGIMVATISVGIVGVSLAPILWFVGDTVSAVKRRMAEINVISPIHVDK
jgi:hypothetical protein